MLFRDIVHAHTKDEGSGVKKFMVSVLISIQTQTGCYLRQPHNASNEKNIIL